MQSNLFFPTTCMPLFAPHFMAMGRFFFDRCAENTQVNSGLKGSTCLEFGFSPHKPKESEGRVKTLKIA